MSVQTPPDGPSGLPPEIAPEVVAAARASVYLSATTVAVDVRAALTSLAEPARRIGRDRLAGARRLVLAGSGGSLAGLFTVQYLLDAVTDLPVSVVPAKELAWRDPAWLGPESLVVLASFSGETQDALAALAFARTRNAPTIAVTGRPASTLARECDDALVYSGASIYEVPIALLLQMVDGSGRAGAGLGELVAGLAELPGLLDDAGGDIEASARAAAERLRESEHLYVIGAGPLSSLAFKLAPVLMENVRIGASFFDASELRHGSVEVLAPSMPDARAPDVLALLGTDASRDTTAGMIRFFAERGARVEVMDAAENRALGIRAAEHQALHPMLSPLVLNARTQWFVAYSALLRGITDLDERIYMGKGLFGPGSWP